MILRRLPDSRYSVVERKWEGATVVLIGGGPSLTREQVEHVRRAHGQLKCIAVNDAYLWATWADVLYAADASWHVAHTKGVDKFMLKLSAAQVREKFASFAGQKCSIQCQEMNIKDDAVHILKNKHFPIHGDGLSLDPTMLVTGRNSGYQAMNLAILAGAKTIVLLGFDGQAKDGKSHWHGGHKNPTPQAAYDEYRRAWSAGEREIKAAGVRMINATPGSAIGFERMGIEEAIARSDVCATAG